MIKHLNTVIPGLVIVSCMDWQRFMVLNEGYITIHKVQMAHNILKLGLLLLIHEIHYNCPILLTILCNNASFDMVTIFISLKSNGIQFMQTIFKHLLLSCSVFIIVIKIVLNG